MRGHHDRGFHPLLSDTSVDGTAMKAGSLLLPQSENSLNPAERDSLQDSFPELLRFIRKRIAQPKHVARLVILALDGVLRAALIKPEHFVCQVQTGDNQLQSAIHADLCLRIDLEMRIEVDIAIWTFQPGDCERRPWLNRRTVRIQIRVVVLEDVSGIVGKAKTRGYAAAVVCWTDIPGVWRLPLQG